MVEALQVKDVEGGHSGGCRSVVGQSPVVSDSL